MNLVCVVQWIRNSSSCPLLLVLGLLTCCNAGWVARQSLQLNIPSTYNATNDLLCHVFVEDVALDDSILGEWVYEETNYECQKMEHDGTQTYYNGASRQVHMPKDIVKKHKAALIGGQWFVMIQDGITSWEMSQSSGSYLIEPGSDNTITTLYVSPIATTTRASISTRSIQPTSDIRTVLVLRVSTMDSVPSNSAAEIHDYLFNNSAPSLQTQYYWCSFGKVHFVPTPHGVLDVSLAGQNAVGATSRDLVEAAYAAANTMLGVSMLEDHYDHVMFCLPPGTNGKWAAAAPVRHWRSVFNDKWCVYISGFMHEIGHNLGLLHANENGIPYTDTSGYMSGGYTQTLWPQRCFNAQNHWYLGWFQDRSLDLTMVPGAGSRLYKLATFVDYDKTSPNDEIVVVRVDKTLYLHFNRAKSFNQGTQKHANKVTIVEFMDGFPGTALLAGLDPQTQPFEISDYKGTQSTLRIDVCKLISGSTTSPDIAVISIGLGSSSSLCSAYIGGQVAIPPLHGPPIPTQPSGTPATPPTAPLSSPTYVTSSTPAALDSSQPSTYVDISIEWIQQHPTVDNTTTGSTSKSPGNGTTTTTGSHSASSNISTAAALQKSKPSTTSAATSIRSWMTKRPFLVLLWVVATACPTIVL